MYQAILVFQYGVFRKETAGSVSVYNNTDKHIKIFEDVDKEACEKQVEDFIKENKFIKMGK